ncbi:hypothetical protein KIN20_003388 [Parelaphostrongylus tenuis]|uniref:Uncharacterized protein n=1 Tax=Parelaphostrongylus tenuis TaxID=148309 RepID=A0AAD5MIB2_PARTN|nr:hypothetical protein KIN20_003388 [Parelaphostrongylus tenuis]
MWSDSCGQASNRTFIITGFTTLPLPMVYSSAANIGSFPGVAPDEAAARGFVQRLVMQTVFDVLESQARNALLPDALISSILDQLSVRINYNPLHCQLLIRPADMTEMTKVYCIIVGNTVTGICTTTAAGNQKMCSMPMAGEVMVTGVPNEHLTISGSFSTTNIIMASWSKAMWESVVNRAVRMLASGPLESNFFSARASVGGN